jgi:leucyl aminopeptidase
MNTYTFDTTCFMSDLLPDAQGSQRLIPIHLIRPEDLTARQKELDAESQHWLARQNFEAKSGEIAWLKNTGSDDAQVWVGWDGKDDLSTLGGLPMLLAAGEYQLADPVSDQQIAGWGLGSYQFTRYKAARRAPARLQIPPANDPGKILNTVQAVALTRDLINTPAADMAPSHLAAEAQALAESFGAQCTVTVGDALLDQSCGAIHAVGRAAEDPPCLIDMTWGDPQHPKITLVGKGVTFDSGGLDIKPASGMRWMKKDMGGGAIVLGLAYLIMAQALPVRLRVLVAAAENAIAGNAFRPGDILHTHKGLTIEIDNTDAEGRLVLCDALSIASEDKPEIIFDFATLTGSARSAVGTEIAAMFSTDDALARNLRELSVACDDAVWQMPLHDSYNYMIESKIADVVNSAASPYAGSVTAALFLQKFVDAPAWVHFDVMAFNVRARPGRPEGGEAMGLRTVYEYLEGRYGAA